VKSEPGLSSESFSPSREECHDINIKVEDLPVLEEEEEEEEEEEDEEEEEEEDPEPVMAPSIGTEHEVSSICVCFCVCVCVIECSYMHVCESMVSHISD